MKLLLTAVNAKYIHSNLAVYSLAAYARTYKCREDRYEVSLAEYTINHHPDQILSGLYQKRPDVLCFSCYIWNIRCVEGLIEEFHKLCPHVPIWVGGPEVSYEAEAFLESHPAVTGVMVGEGEETFLELCRYYGGGGGLFAIAGIVYRDGSRICSTGTRQPLDMNKIPFCYQSTEDFKNRIIYYESSRGCPFSCSYCLSSVDKRLRFRDVELVKRELAFFMDKQVPQVKFVDRTFNCSRAHALAIWRFIREQDNGVTNFHFEISADLLGEEELTELAAMRPGLVQLEIGVQSTNPATIAEIHRTMELGRLKETVLRIRAAGNIHQHLDLIAGLPWEDYDSFVRSFDEVYALKPNQLQLGFLKLLKGSYLYEHAKEYGVISHTGSPYEVLQTDWLSYDDILRIKRVEEMLEVYYNSGQFEVTMKVLECCLHSAFAMFAQLGDFYERQGYFGMSHSRLRRCEILLEFVEKYYREATDVIKESLIFDLYYRENAKTRPAWAANPAEWKPFTRRLCKCGSQSHLERFSYRFPDKSVPTIVSLPRAERQPVYVLFDYARRDPLDHQAHVQEVELSVGNQVHA